MSTATFLNGSGTGFFVTNIMLDSDGNSFSVIATSLDSDGNAFLIFNTIIINLNAGSGDSGDPVLTQAMQEEKIIMMIVRQYLKIYL